MATVTTLDELLQHANDAWLLDERHTAKSMQCSMPYDTKQEDAMVLVLPENYHQHKDVFGQHARKLYPNLEFVLGSLHMTSQDVQNLVARNKRRETFRNEVFGAKNKHKLCYFDHSLYNQALALVGGRKEEVEGEGEGDDFKQEVWDAIKEFNDDYEDWGAGIGWPSTYKESMLSASLAITGKLFDLLRQHMHKEDGKDDNINTDDLSLLNKAIEVLNSKPKPAKFAFDVLVPIQVAFSILQLVMRNSLHANRFPSEVKDLLNTADKYLCMARASLNC